MLPENLVGMYQSYKNDIDSIAAWLASTAKSCGYKLDPATAGPTKEASSKRLKGKARAAAKKKNAAAAKAAQVTKFTVKVKDFVPLAEFIASKPHVSIPTSFMITLRRIIDLRRGLGDKPAQHGAATDEFVGILEKVQDIFLPPTETSTTTPNGFANMFSTLTTYEASEKFESAPVVERPKPSEDTDLTYEAESLTALEDVIIATTLLIMDLNKIRLRIEWMWLKWSKGAFDLAAAAIATNTSIELASNLMDDVMPLINACGGLHDILPRVFLRQAANVGYMPPDPSNLDTLHGEGFPVADMTYLLTYKSLKGMVRAIEAEFIPIYKEDGPFGHYDPQSNRRLESGLQRALEDRALLMKFFTELMAVERKVAGYPVMDEFLRGVKELVATKQVSFHLVFAAQIFVDIHHKLHADAQRGFDVLEKDLNLLETEIEEHLQYHKDRKLEIPADMNEKIQRTQEKIRWVLKDPVYNAKLDVFQRMGKPVPASIERNRILRMSPVLSGLMVYHFRAEVWDFGIKLANSWGSISCSLHLYNSLRAEKLTPGFWADMHTARTLLGDSNFFVGDTPTTPDDYFKKFCVQIGMKPAAFTKNHRVNKAASSRSGPREIQGSASVSCMFMDRYWRNAGEVDWTPDGNKLPKETRAMHPEQLVRSLLYSLNVEAIQFAFPWAVMHRRCWSLLEAVRRHCDPLLKQVFTPAYLERESDLCLIVGYIFMATKEKMDAKLLSEAGVAVREFVRAHGDDMLGLLRDINLGIGFVPEEPGTDLSELAARLNHAMVIANRNV
ncbi:hypothetical protein F4818DRAFT_438672 [Hypoxylon cercidicola]|nr:hypothetical protein F4818DRAFT_438672 [Hypoxylon cercidicola]